MKGKERRLHILSSALYTNGSIMQVTRTAEAESYERPRTWRVMNGLKPAAFRPMKTGRARRKESNPRYTVECAPRLLLSLAPSVRGKALPRPEIASVANSNVKLDFRVDFSGIRRKALQASPWLQSRAEIKTFSSFSTSTAPAPLRSARARAQNPCCPRSLKVFLGKATVS